MKETKLTHFNGLDPEGNVKVEWTPDELPERWMAFVERHPDAEFLTIEFSASPSVAEREKTEAATKRFVRGLLFCGLAYLVFGALAIRLVTGHW